MPQIKKKLVLVSNFLDIYLTARIVNQQNILYNTVIVALFGMVKEIRKSSLSGLKSSLKTILRKSDLNFTKFEELSYQNTKSKHLLHILARIACHINEESNITGESNFIKLTDRRRANRTYDIEHLLADQFIVHNHSIKKGGTFYDEEDFKDQRNRIGGLVLLPRDINRSLKDKTYKEKLNKYISENVLTKSLCMEFYTNNPKLKKFLEVSKIDIRPIKTFKRDFVKQRALVYKSVASQIWSIHRIK